MADALPVGNIGPGVTLLYGATPCNQHNVPGRRVMLRRRHKMKANYQDEPMDMVTISIGTGDNHDYVHARLPFDEFVQLVAGVLRAPDDGKEHADG